MFNCSFAYIIVTLSYVIIFFPSRVYHSSIFLVQHESFDVSIMNVIRFVSFPIAHTHAHTTTFTVIIHPLEKFSLKLYNKTAIDTDHARALRISQTLFFFGTCVRLYVNETVRRFLFITFYFHTSILPYYI